MPAEVGGVLAADGAAGPVVGRHAQPALYAVAAEPVAAGQPGPGLGLAFWGALADGFLADGAGGIDVHGGAVGLLVFGRGCVSGHEVSCFTR